MIESSYQYHGNEKKESNSMSGLQSKVTKKQIFEIDYYDWERVETT
jgi:hypothetical protein